jgi:hypothetical protein
MFQPEPTRAQYEQAIAERDEAVDERDYLLNFMHDMGAALSQGELLGLVPTPRGIELRALYPSDAAALTVANFVRDMRAMFSKANYREPDAAAFERCEAEAAHRLSA